MEVGLKNEMWEVEIVNIWKLDLNSNRNKIVIMGF